MKIMRVPSVPKTPRFEAYSFNVTVESLEEAVALRALLGGVSRETANKIAEGASHRPSTLDTVLYVCNAIGSEASLELQRQGV